MKILKKALLLGCVLAIGFGLAGCSVKTSNITGETLVDKDYVNNLLPMLSMYVSVEAVPNCKNVEILDTKITKQPAGKDAKEWEEVWTLGACGKKVEVPLSLKDEDKRIQTFITSDKMKVLK